jgi:protease-4
MSLSADQLADRVRLKRETKRWRLLALLFLGGALLVGLRGETSLVTPHKPYIARVTVDGFIGDDIKRDELLEDIESDKQVKAVLVRFDSPGGTALGGEDLYRRLKSLSEKKPVIAVMRTMCASACYMASLGTTHMMARDSSITGSVGVLIEMAEFTELAKKLGIEPITVKSGELKASPSPLEKFSPEQRDYIQDVINDSFAQFLALVTGRRTLDESSLALVKDGRIFTGKQARALNLIDEIGGESEALAWLEKNKKIPANLRVVDLEPEKEAEGLLSQFEQSARHIILGSHTQRLDGLLAIWQPTLK